MAKARKTKQISFTIPNKIGLLSEIATAIAGAKVNIGAICAYGMENTAYFMLTTDSNAKAKKAIAALGFGIEEEDVVEVEMANKPGELQKRSPMRALILTICTERPEQAKGRPVFLRLRTTRRRFRSSINRVCP